MRNIVILCCKRFLNSTKFLPMREVNFMFCRKRMIAEQFLNNIYSDLSVYKASESSLIVLIFLSINEYVIVKLVLPFKISIMIRFCYFIQTKLFARFTLLSKDILTIVTLFLNLNFSWLKVIYLRV